MADKVGTDLRPGVKTLDYDETLMYGRYTKELGAFAKTEAAKVRSGRQELLHRRKKKEPPPSGFRVYTAAKCEKCERSCVWFKEKFISRIGEDWVFLTLLGIIMALLSFSMDYAIEKCQEARKWLHAELDFSVAAQYFAWIIFPLVFICFSTGFVHIVGPNAIGSGIPEMKTILRGVVLKEYLTLRTLISKSVGLCTSLGCGIPIGKEGPFVHIASIAATLLGKVITSFKGVYVDQSRNNEMLSAACAVGVACTFAAPIGGVLFSIEVTATYFAVRNYWRGFYSAVCGAFVFRLLSIWFRDEETLTALFKTNLRQEFPFDPLELFAFAVIGIVCGFGGALFVYMHRKIVEVIRKQKRISTFLQRNRFLFPSIVVFVIMSVMFPPGLGQFMAGELTNHVAVNELFSNWTWSDNKPEDYLQAEVLQHWQGPLGNIYVTMVLFVISRFCMAAIANTLPVPAGVFIPVFTIGAAFGRLMGECMAVWFPQGIGGRMVLPGGYAIVGAAALSGSVTHTVSTSVIVFELTGQMGHVLPCVIAVLISNVVAHTLQPSIYDSLIIIKNLPYLPDIINPTQTNAYQLYVEDFMLRDPLFMTSFCSYADAVRLLEDSTHRAFPLVDSKENMILLGSIPRAELERILDQQLGIEKKMEYFTNLSRVRHVPDITVTDAAGGEPHSLDRRKAAGATGTSQVHAQVHTHTPLTSTSSVPSARSGRFSISKTEAEEPATPGAASYVSSQRSDSLSSDTFHAIDIDQIPSNMEDLTPEQEGLFENNQLMQRINFDDVQINPAPFQLVEKTSLYKVHSLFSLLGLNHAYVTNTGRLVGIVGMKEVRYAIQGHMRYKGEMNPSPQQELDRELSVRLSQSDDLQTNMAATPASASRLRNVPSTTHTTERRSSSFDA